MPKSYEKRVGIFSGFYSCAFVTKTGSWWRQNVYAPGASIFNGDQPTKEPIEKYKERMQKVLDEILTKSETIPVLFITRDDAEKDFEEMIREYPDIITLACDTQTQHPGEKHRVRLWVAHQEKVRAAAATTTPEAVGVGFDDYFDEDEQEEVFDEIRP